jgi:uncharacterized protein (TIGR03083 family)
LTDTAGRERLDWGAHQGRQGGVQEENMGQSYEWDDLMWVEMGDLGAFLHELPDEEFDRPSLCEGWEVRDVVGHMLLGHTTPMPKMLAMLGRYRFNVTRASLEESRTFAHSLTPDEIRAEWDDVVANKTKRGIAKVIRSTEGYVDHTVHHQDIRRAVERPRTIPPDRLVAALDGAVSVSSPMFSPKKNVRDVRLEATDVEWSHGTGPVVRGNGEAILMAAAGRTAALAELEGDGLSTLTGHLS